MYKVELTRAAGKQLKKLSKAIQRRVVRRLEEFESEPRSSGVKKLSGSTDFYRVRVGDYRIVYRIDDQVLLILVVKVGDRKDVYRTLLG